MAKNALSDFAAAFAAHLTFLNSTYGYTVATGSAATNGARVYMRDDKVVPIDRGFYVRLCTDPKYRVNVRPAGVKPLIKLGLKVATPDGKILVGKIADPYANSFFATDCEEVDAKGNTVRTPSGLVSKLLTTGQPSTDYRAAAAAKQLTDPDLAVAAGLDAVEGAWIHLTDVKDGWYRFLGAPTNRKVYNLQYCAYKGGKFTPVKDRATAIKNSDPDPDDLPKSTNKRTSANS